MRACCPAGGRACLLGSHSGSGTPGPGPILVCAVWVCRVTAGSGGLECEENQELEPLGGCAVLRGVRGLGPVKGLHVRG